MDLHKGRRLSRRRSLPPERVAALRPPFRRRLQAYPVRIKLRGVRTRGRTEPIPGMGRSSQQGTTVLWEDLEVALPEEIIRGEIIKASDPMGVTSRVGADHLDHQVGDPRVGVRQEAGRLDPRAGDHRQEDRMDHLDNQVGAHQVGAHRVEVRLDRPDRLEAEIHTSRDLAMLSSLWLGLHRPNWNCPSSNAELSGIEA